MERFNNIVSHFFYLGFPFVIPGVMIRLSFLKKNIDSLIAAAAGFFIIFLFTRHSGIGICPDGVVYTTAAENLRATGKYIDFTHGPVIDFPAFYSIFLSGLIWLTGL